MNISVFLSDDHTMFREGLKLLIESKPGLKVIGEAANGRDAVRQAGMLKPDVVLMDVFMPGEEIIQAIKSVHVGRRYLCESISSMVIDDYVKFRKTGEKSDDLARLSRREREILQLLAEGKANGQIAEVLNLSPSTVGTYRFRIMQKLGIGDLAGLIKFAMSKGLVHPG